VGAIKERGQKWAIINKILEIFNPILALRQKLKNLVNNFVGINMRNLHAKFQPSSFKTEGGDRG